MKDYIKKADIVLFIVLVVIGLLASVYLTMSKTGGDTVIIEQNGKLYGKYSLYRDTEVDVVAVDSIRSDVHVSIKDATAKVTKSGCKNQVCVRHSAINSVGESIICLPNKVVVKIEGKGGGYDAITN